MFKIYKICLQALFVDNYKIIYYLIYFSSYLCIIVNVETSVITIFLFIKFLIIFPSLSFRNGANFGLRRF